MEQNSSTGTFIANPFYIFISLLLGALTFFGIRDLWISGSSANAVFLFTLYLVHIGLFWSNVRDFENPRWWMFYYPIQVMLVLVIVNLPFTSDFDLTLLGSSILCLIGESLGLWGNTRRALYIGLSLFGFMLITLYLLVERGQFIFAVSNLLVNGGFIVLLMVMFNQQIAERQKAVDLAESLESANAKLAASSAKIESLTLQTERQRMARELHDTLAQGVAGLVLQLEAIKNHLKAERGERALAIVEQSLVRARSTLAESRAAIDDLRAESALNLSESVREQVERFTQATGIPCELDLNVGEQVISSEVSEHALRVLSEALANVARHAQATQVTVKFILHQQQLELEVRDNGKGFDVASETNAGHYGLLGMRERARLTGGTLTIESKAQSGTNVRFVVPSERLGVLR